MPHTFFDARRISTLIALLLIIALAALIFASAPAETQTSPTDATATPTPTGTATPTPTPTGTATATGTPTPTPTATPTTDPDATATPTGTATATATSTPTPTSTATATATSTPTPTPTSTVPPANADYDVDNDGLIEIRTLAQLNAVRHDIDGDGKQGAVSAADWATYTTAFLNAASDMGCRPTDHDSNAATPQQATCEGYELMMDLNFDTNRDGEVNSSDTYPNWTPIGTAASPFTATFKGSLTNDVMPKIYNLTITSISGSASANAGLFGATDSTARIEGVALVDVNVSIDTSAHSHLNPKIGALVGYNSGDIIACYSTGAITASVSAGGYAGGLVGYNTGTISAAFSRATVSMSIHADTLGNMYMYAGGLAGHNSGTLKATYAAGAVKGAGDSDTNDYIGGLVGDNTGTINASYSIAPVTAADSSSGVIVGGLIGKNGSSATVTASYWDYISSGIDDDSGDALPEGKSTHELTSPTSFDTGIYADWDDLTIDSANDVDPWVIDDARFHPLLTYGGHTTAISGNQLFVNGGIGSRYGGNAIHPHEGMTLYSSIGSYGGGVKRARHSNPSHTWTWQGSSDGIAWTTLAPIHGLSFWASYGMGNTFLFVPKPEHVGKYIRAKIGVRTGGHAYTRVIGKIKAAATANALGFASGHNPPRIEGEVTIESLPSGAVGLWYRCDANTVKPPTTGCELVGSRASYTPENLDLGHYLYAYIYYKNASGTWLRSDVGFTQNKVGGFRGSQWRGAND